MENIQSQQFKKIFQEERNGIELVDVRGKDEYDLIRVRGSKLIPLDQIESRMNEIDWKKKVIIICRSGSRSAYAAQLLSSFGKKAYNLYGGVRDLYLMNCSCLEKSPEFSERYF